jgi:hypothetical protein
LSIVSHVVLLLRCSQFELNNRILWQSIQAVFCVIPSCLEICRLDTPFFATVINILLTYLIVGNGFFYLVGVAPCRIGLPLQSWLLYQRQLQPLHTFGANNHDGPSGYL